MLSAPVQDEKLVSAHPVDAVLWKDTNKSFIYAADRLVTAMVAVQFINAFQTVNITQQKAGRKSQIAVFSQIVQCMTVKRAGKLVVITEMF